MNIERARFSPSATINYSKSENEDFNSTIDEKNQETVKATVTWPIIKGGENISSIKKSSFNKQRSQLILQDMKNKIVTETSNSWSKYQSSKSVPTCITTRVCHSLIGPWSRSSKLAEDAWTRRYLNDTNLYSCIK